MLKKIFWKTVKKWNLRKSLILICEYCLQEKIQIANSPRRYFLCCHIVVRTLSYFCHYFINENIFVRSIKSKISLGFGLLDSIWDKCFVVSPRWCRTTYLLHCVYLERQFANSPCPNLLSFNVTELLTLVYA